MGSIDRELGASRFRKPLGPTKHRDYLTDSWLVECLLQRLATDWCSNSHRRGPTGGRGAASARA